MPKLKSRLPSVVPVALLALLPGSLGAAEPQGRPPNIIVLLNDDQGSGDLGVAGHPFIKTPHLDRLAQEGCRFTDFYATAPVCSPSRAGFITGRIQSRFGLHHLINGGEKADLPLFQYIPPTEPMLPRLLHQAGYATAHFGKWHCSFSERPGSPSMRDYGFDTAKILNAGRMGSYFNSKWDGDEGRTQSTDRWTADAYVDDAIAFIERSGDRPFFVNLWSFAPHQEVEASSEFRALYADLPENEQHYFGAISQMDAAYGRLLEFLKQKGLMDNTIIFFSSDNGPEPHLIPWSDRARGSTGGLRGAKHALYEGGIRVPAIVYWPGVAVPGSVCRQPVWMPDVTATFCAAAGVSAPDDRPFDGVDLRPALRGKTLSRPDPLFWQFPYRGVGLRDSSKATSPPLALRDGSWKMLCNDDFTGVELYNLEVDRSEQWNMQKEYPEVTARLLAAIRRMQDSVNTVPPEGIDNLSPAMKLPDGKKASDYPRYAPPGT